ncbi:hypothetical protein [Methylovorus glucosotrophus]|uniref:Uncharacterized protein n=1 Tax=Methylovorus glucosotrophus (strain SIP3-4) TaxID=582744 RepID=C6XDF5_METGS|nr:hypothetical protein [Methylovorus glucosotrophus]ACT50580.1 hypothetical protein Msip34_1334 [Methylovorus glucosotrophus SIP3-4]
MSKISFLKEIQFIVWVIPVLGFLFSIIFDWGYLSYFDIPFFFVEVNYYTAFTSILSIALISIGILYVLAIGVILSDKNNILYSIFFDPFILSITFIFIILGLSSNHSLTPVPLLYLCFIIMKSLHLLTVFLKNKSINNSIKGIYWPIFFNFDFFKMFNLDLYKILDKEAADDSSRESPVPNRYKSFAGYITAILLSSLVMTIAGDVAANSLPKWTLKGRDDVVVIARNNGIYLLKSFNPSNLVLEESVQILKSDDNSITLVPLKLKGSFTTEEEYKKRIEEHKKNLELDEYFSQNIKSFWKFLLSTHIENWI